VATLDQVARLRGLAACCAGLTALLIGAVALRSDGRVSSAILVKEVLLANGLRVLVVTDARVPRVGASLWYRVGAIQEPAGEHGSTHFLEHAIHQGTTTVGTRDFEAEKPLLREIDETERKVTALRNRERNRLRERDIFFNEFDWPAVPEIDELQRRLYQLEDLDATYRDFWAEFRWYRRYGGVVWRHTDPVPATTGLEHMEIDMDLPREHLELFFRLEADRMVNAVLRGWEAQRLTVLEQVFNGKSQPDARFQQALDGVTGASHPQYVLGSSSGHARDFGFFTRAAMLRIYDDYFVPNNATLVIVGDVTVADVAPLADRYFGRIPRGPEPPARMDQEADPPPGGTVRLDWSEPLSPRVLIRHRIPGVGHPDRPIVDTIAALVSGRHGLLLTRFADDRRLADEVVGGQASAVRSGSPGMFNVVAFASRDEDLPLLESSMLALFDDLREGRLDQDALRRAQTKLQLDWDQIRSSRGLLSFHLGHFQVMDRWNTLQTFMDVRQRATIADIQRVARRYFVPANRIIATTRRRADGSFSGTAARASQ
jgi:predicted Zn-dependent peptidase